MKRSVSEVERLDPKPLRMPPRQPAAWVKPPHPQIKRTQYKSKNHDSRCGHCGLELPLGKQRAKLTDNFSIEHARLRGDHRLRCAGVNPAGLETRGDIERKR